MKIKELKTEIEMTIERKQNILSTIEGAENPQTIEIFQSLTIEIKTLNTILNRIKGDRLAIHIL